MPLFYRRLLLSQLRFMDPLYASLSLSLSLSCLRNNVPAGISYVNYCPTLEDGLQASNL